MDFLNPALLFGATAIAMPIVLHLIMRQNPRLVEFPALRFLKLRQETNQRRLKLRHLLLLILRCAALCLLALALARPSMKTSGTVMDQQAPVAAAMIFDTSPRMLYRDQNKTRLEAAQETGLWLLGELPAESQVAVFESRLGAAVFQIDLGAAKQRIERLETTARPEELLKVATEAAQLLATSELPSREIYIFTDLTRPGWKDDAAEKLRAELKKLKDVGIQIIDVGIEKPTNFALGEVRLSGQVLAQGSALRIETDLSLRGQAGQRNVQLWLDEIGENGVRTRVHRGSTGHDLQDGQSRRVEFRLNVNEPGTYQGVLRFDGEDGLAIDDVRYFTVDVKPPWSVLVVAPSPAEEYGFFLTGALGDWFKTETIALDQLPAAKLDGYAAVCLLDPTPLPPEMWRKLRDYSALGGGLAIFLGHNAVPVDSFNQPAAQEVLPGRLALQARDPNGELFLSPESYQHPLLAKFRAMAGTVPWEGYPVFRYWQLDELNDGVGVVIPYSNNRPALLERPIGKGRALTLTTPISDSPNNKAAWNYLPTGDLEFGVVVYVMLTNETLLYLVGSTEGQLNYTAGQTAVLQLDRNDTATSYLLSMPAKPKSGPAEATEYEAPLRRTIDSKLRTIIETATDRPGNYRIGAGGEQGLERGFSVNLSPEASDLTRIDDEQLKKIFGEQEYRRATNREQIERQVSGGRVGRELFPLFIILVAIVLGLEHILSNRFYWRS